MKLTYAFFTFAFLSILGVNAQETGPAYVGSADSMVHVPSLESRMDELTPAIVKDEEMQDGRVRSSKREAIPGKGNQEDYFSKNQHYLQGKLAGRAPDLVFEGALSNSSPTDPSIAIGPDHVFVVFNTGFAIYDKDGNELLGQTAPNPAIFPAGGCCDLTVSYDNAEDRWVLSFLGGGAQVAVSDGPDPLTAGWNVYNINTINDYQKLSVWSDAYYMTDQSNGNRLYAMEKDAMLAGEPAADVSIQGFTLPDFSNLGFASPQALNISDDNTPAPGNAPIVFYQDDAYAGVTEDHIKFWTANPDFDVPANSTISAPEVINVTPFTSVFDGTSFSNLQEPGGAVPIDVLQGIVMNQAQFRKFPTYNSAIFDFAIDVGGAGGPAKQAAIRWYEFRQDAEGMPWVLEQEGTFSLPDGKHAWHGSMIMDDFGNIGLGYTAMGNTATGNGTDEQTSSYYTGRFAADPAGSMTIAPQLIAAGTAPISQGNERYGDYGKVDLDPTDGLTMWFINEYRGSNGRADVVGRFKIAPDFNIDVGASAIVTPVDGVLTATETVEVSLFNFGMDDQSNFPVTLSVDGTVIATETFTGTIVATTSETFTFTTTVDLSTEGQAYEICVSTGLTGDENGGNDETCKTVTNVFAADIGATAITSPESGEGLGNETVTITIENFGAVEQSNFDASFSVDGTVIATESVTGPIAPGATLDYTFAATADLSAIASYAIVATTALTGDSDTANDPTSKTVSNFDCTSVTNDTAFPIGPDAGAITNSVITFTDDFVIGDVNVNLNIEHTWNADLIIELVAPDNSSVELANANGGQDDNFTDTTFDDEATQNIADGTAPFTGVFSPVGDLSDFNGLQSVGDWTLRITDTANGDGGQLLDWTLQLCAGIPLSTNDFANNTELIVVDNGNDQYKLTLPTSSVTDKLTFSVMNMQGQILSRFALNNENGTGYEYDLDMSYVASGIYIVRIGNKDFGGVQRLIVR